MPKIFFPSLKPRFLDREKLIREFKRIARSLAKRNSKVEEIFLFGSFAHGNAGLRSDADILVILSEDSRSMMDRLDEFILAFADGPTPVDVLAYTRQELNKALGQENRFIQHAIRGIPLVEKETSASSQKKS